VIFILHETFPNPQRTVENVNPATGGFELEETAYGGFPIIIKMYFQQYASEKWQQRSHFVQLEPYSLDPDPVKAQEEMERQRKDKVISEVIEVIEFNEPTEQLWDALTSEAQFDYLKPRGKGKNRASIGGAASENGNGNCDEPPPTAEKGQLWSLEQENLIIDKLLQNAGNVVDKQLQQVLQRGVEVNKALDKLKSGDEIDDQLKSVYESLPPKKK
jgi:YEATS domain-containing protein 4